MQQSWEVAEFARRTRRYLRFDEVSCAPLQVPPVDLRSDAVECDWMVPTAERWDASLERRDREEHESLQALADAIAVRNLVFDVFPKIDCAVLRGFRQLTREPPRNGSPWGRFAESAGPGPS